MATSDSVSRSMSAAKLHRFLLLGLAVLTIGFSILVWVDPSFGYASSDSIIAGADLRADVTKIAWILFGTFAVVSSLVVFALQRKIERRLVVIVIAYAAAAGALVPVCIVIDKLM